MRRGRGQWRRAKSPEASPHRVRITAVSSASTLSSCSLKAGTGICTRYLDLSNVRRRVCVDSVQESDGRLNLLSPGCRPRLMLSSYRDPTMLPSHVSGMIFRTSEMRTIVAGSQIVQAAEVAEAVTCFCKPLTIQPRPTDLCRRCNAGLHLNLDVHSKICKFDDLEARPKRGMFRQAILEVDLHRLQNRICQRYVVGHRERWVCLAPSFRMRHLARLKSHGHKPVRTFLKKSSPPSQFFFYSDLQRVYNECCAAIAEAKTAA